MADRQDFGCPNGVDGTLGVAPRAKPAGITTNTRVASPRRTHLQPGLRWLLREREVVAGKLVGQQATLDTQRQAVATLEHSLAVERARLAELAATASETASVIRALEASIQL